jgi:hypothetical protein
MNRRDLIFSDLRTEDSGSVSLNRRTDAVRDATSITLRPLFVSNLQSGRNFFRALFDRPIIAPQINGLFSGARSSTG